MLVAVQAVPWADRTSVCFCPNRSARQTFEDMAHARSTDGDCATGYVGCGRFGFFHHDALAIGKNLVNTSLLGLQHTLSRSKYLLAGSRESRTGYGGKLIFQYLDVVLLVWHNESFCSGITIPRKAVQSNPVFPVSPRTSWALTGRYAPHFSPGLICYFTPLLVSSACEFCWRI